MLIAQALLTALLSGLFSGAIVFALNERRERGNLLLTKIELAIDAYARWVDVISRWPLTHYDLWLAGSYAEGKPILDAIWREAETEQRRAKLLIQIYLPANSNVIGEVCSAYYEFINVSKEIGEAAIQGQPMPESAKPAIADTANAITKAGHIGLQQLLTAARDHAHAPFLIRTPRLRLRRNSKAAEVSAR